MAFGYELYFTRRYRNQVIAWNPDRNSCAVMVDDSANAVGNLNRPYGLAVDKSGTLFVADKLNHRVCKAKKNGKLESVVTRDGEDRRAPQLTRQKDAPLTPTGIAVEASGSLLCSFCDEHTIYRIKSDGSLELVLGIAPGTHYTLRGYVEKVPEEKLAAAPIFWPTALTQNGAGELYFVERGYESVRRYRRGEGLSAVFPGEGENDRATLPDSAAELPLPSYRPAHPSGLALDAEGRLFVSDGMLGSVVRVDFKKNTFKIILPPQGHCIGALPLALGVDGTLWMLHVKKGNLRGYAESRSGYWQPTGHEIATEEGEPSGALREWAGLACG